MRRPVVWCRRLHRKPGARRSYDQLRITKFSIIKNMHKRNLLTLCILFLLAKADAQITKGNWLVGGNFSYSKDKSMGNDVINSKSRTVDIMPNAGYFVVDKLALGARLNVGSSKQKYPQAQGQNVITQNSFGVGPFIRYYLLKPDKIVNIFSEGGIVYETLTSKNSGSVQGREKSILKTAAIGAVVFLNSAVGLEVKFGYSNLKVFNKDAREKNIQLNLGFQIHLEKN